MYDSISFSLQQNNITKKVFKVFSNSHGEIFLSLHYFRAEEYHCGNAFYPPGVAAITLSPIIEGKKSPIPVKVSFHEDGQVHFKPINPKKIDAQKFFKFAEVKATPFASIVAQHIFTLEVESLDRFDDFKPKEKKEFYGIFRIPNDAVRYKFLGYLGRSEHEVLNLISEAKVFTINRKGNPSQLYLGIHVIPFKDSLDKSSTLRPVFYFLGGFTPELPNQTKSANFLYIYAK